MQGALGNGFCLSGGLQTGRPKGEAEGFRLIVVTVDQAGGCRSNSRRTSTRPGTAHSQSTAGPLCIRTFTSTQLFVCSAGD